MDDNADYRSSVALLSIELDTDEHIRDEAGAMVSDSGDSTIETAASGGVRGSLKRRVLGSENSSRTASPPTVPDRSPSHHASRGDADSSGRG